MFFTVVFKVLLCSFQVVVNQDKASKQIAALRSEIQNLTVELMEYRQVGCGLLNKVPRPQLAKLDPFTQKVHSPNLPKRDCMCDVLRIGSIIIFHLSKL